MALPKIDNEVPQVSAQTATFYVQRMVKLEEVRSGSKENALHQIATDYKIGFWQLTHLFKGRAKTCDVGLYARIRSAYLDRCAKMVAALQHDLEVEGAVHGDAVDQDLLAQAAALAAEVAAQRAAFNQRGQVK